MSEKEGNESYLNEFISFSLIKRIIKRRKYLIFLATIIAPLFSNFILPTINPNSTTARYQISLNSRDYLPSSIEKTEDDYLKNTVYSSCSTVISETLLNKIIFEPFFIKQYTKYNEENNNLKDYDFDIENLSHSDIVNMHIIEYTSESKKSKKILENYIAYINYHFNNIHSECLQRVIEQYKGILVNRTMGYDSSEYKNISKYVLYLDKEKSKNYEYLSIIDSDEVNNSTSSLYNLIISFTLIYALLALIILIQENLLGFINEKDMFLEKLFIKYIDTIYKNNTSLSNKILYKYIQNIRTNEDNIKLSIYFLQDKHIKKDPIKINEKLTPIEFIDIKNEDDVNSTDYIFIFAEAGKVKISNIDQINKYLNIHSDKILGWFYIDEL